LINDVLGPHIKQDKWMSLKEKLHDGSIPMKVEIMAAIMKKSSSQSMG